MKILHVIDPTTSEDALEMLAALVARQDSARVLALGHQSIVSAAIKAGIPRPMITSGRALGWADPICWRNLSQAVARYQPELLQAWGFYGLMGGTLLRNFAGARIFTLAQTPTSGQLRLQRLLAQRVPWMLVASSSSILRKTLTAGWPVERAIRIRPGIALGRVQGQREKIRAALELTASDWPVIVLGGPSIRASRHDHGLWAAAIIQQIFPHTKVLWRQPTPWQKQHDVGIQDFKRAIPNSAMLIPVAHDLAWPDLVQAADLLLASADQPIPIGSILWAMATAGLASGNTLPPPTTTRGSVPVVATALDEIAELVEHQHTGLLTPVKRSHQNGGPKALAARMEELLANRDLSWKLADQARAQIFENFKPGTFFNQYAWLYHHLQENPTAELAATKFSTMFPPTA